MVRRFVLTERLKSRLEGLTGRQLVCHVCGEPLEIGQKIAVRGYHSQRLKRYHEDCFEGLFLILE